MPIQIDAEATCHNCGAKARCTIDADLFISKRFASPGGAIRGLPDWFYKEGNQSLACTDNLACSQKCAAALTKTSTHGGEWKHCGAHAPIG
jgi:hypothetical protein